jgi:hypothetical protein
LDFLFWFWGFPRDTTPTRHTKGSSKKRNCVLVDALGCTREKQSQMDEIF